MREPTPLDEYEAKVLRAIPPDYDVLVIVVPSYADVNEFAAAGALASLKKRKLIQLGGRGTSQFAFLTNEGKSAYATLSDPPKCDHDGWQAGCQWCEKQKAAADAAMGGR